jgi:ABC-type multidrug transport system ATPase subunit
MDEAELCNRVALLFNGRVLVSGSPVELKRVDVRVFELTVPEGRAFDEKDRGLLREIAVDVTFTGARIRATVEPGKEQALRAALPAGLRLQERSPSIEDVFIDAVRKTAEAAGGT